MVSSRMRTVVLAMGRADGDGGVEASRSAGVIVWQQAKVVLSVGP